MLNGDDAWNWESIEKQITNTIKSTSMPSICGITPLDGEIRIVAQPRAGRGAIFSIHHKPGWIGQNGDQAYMITEVNYDNGELSELKYPEELASNINGNP